MGSNWETDWILYSFDPPLKLDSKTDHHQQDCSKKNTRGYCAKCQRQIGRGIAIHQKHCKG